MFFFSLMSFLFVALFLFLPCFCFLFMCCAMSFILKASIENWRGHPFYLGSSI